MSRFAKTKGWTHWCTPRPIWEAVRHAFGGVIDLDPCSNEHSTVPATVKFTVEDNGLEREWAPHRRIFINPPYGKEIHKWAAKIISERARSRISSVGRHVNFISLVPCAPSSKWFASLANFTQEAAIVLVHKRIAFEGGPCAVDACGLPPWEHPGVGHAYVEPRSSPSVQSCFFIYGPDHRTLSFTLAQQLSLAGYPSTYWV